MLCLSAGAALSGNHRKETWKDAERCAPAPRQRTGAQEQSSDQQSGELRLRVVASPALFSRPRSLRLPPLPQHEETAPLSRLADNGETMAAVLITLDGFKTHLFEEGLKALAKRWRNVFVLMQTT